jgi:hypothetical protein
MMLVGSKDLQASQSNLTTQGIESIEVLCKRIGFIKLNPSREEKWNETK